MWRGEGGEVGRERGEVRGKGGKVGREWREEQRGVEWRRVEVGCDVL